MNELPPNEVNRRDRKDRRDEENGISAKIIGCAIEVHRELGPGLLESSYEACLAYELAQLGLKVERQKPLPVVYREVEA